jgi:hypothetical protein
MSSLQPNEEPPRPPNPPHTRLLQAVAPLEVLEAELPLADAVSTCPHRRTPPNGRQARGLKFDLTLHFGLHTHASHTRTRDHGTQHASDATCLEAGKWLFCALGDSQPRQAASGCRLAFIVLTRESGRFGFWIWSS